MQLVAPQVKTPPAPSRGLLRLVSTLPHAVYGNAIVDLMDVASQESRQKLVEALDRSAACGSDHDRAWMLRRALDDVLSTLQSGNAPHRSMPTSTFGASAATGTIDLSRLTWTVVDDRVMGGSSQSRIAFDANGNATFEGRLVVDGGGFASVRANLPLRGYGLAGANGLALRCSGDGRQGYKVIFKTDTAWDGVMYQASFEAPPSPAEFTLPFSAFRATFRGQPVANAPPLRGEAICVIGFMLSRFDAAGRPTDERAAPFRLHIASVSSC